MSKLSPMLILILLLMLSTAAAAQMPLMISPPPPDVVGQPKHEELRLSRVNTEVRIHGWLAETRTTMTFANPTGRNLAGDLYFPLPEGATISGYALDVNGAMVDGVVVEKDKGREVFEKEVRKGIDPGLVEWVKGNSFKTRVFPIPPHGSRTVMVRYVSSLIRQNGAPAYLLPLHFSKKVDEFRLRVEVVKGATFPVVSGALPGLSFGKWRESYVAETVLKDIAPAQNLVIGLPDLEKRKAELERSADGSVYFTIHDQPALMPPKPSAPPKKIGILWDSSASRGDGDHELELEVIKRFFARYPAATMDVELRLFSNAAEAPRQFKIKNGDAGALLNELRQVFYDGGTQLGAIAPAEDAALPDFYLLFSDGISNFGAEEPARLPRPVYVFSDAARANHPFLRYLAMKSGGEYFNLSATDAATAAARTGAPGFAFISASYDGNLMTDVTPAVPQPVQGPFTISGKLLAGRGTITLNYGIAGEVLQRVEYALDAAEAAPGELGALTWAMQRLDELQILPKRNKLEISAIGRRFGLVTPGTSLLVLESLNQYVEHRIEPPASLPEMRRQYLEVVARRGLEDERKKEDKLQYVLGLWQKRIAWWEKVFEYPKSYRFEEPAKLTAGSGSAARQDMGYPSALPAPAPMMAAEAAREEAQARYQAERERVAGARAERSASKAKAENKELAPEAPQAEIRITPWNPDTPYLKQLQGAAPGERHALYHQLRQEYGNSPAFFLDCADFFLKQGNRSTALRVLSNIAELELENAALLRILAHRLEQMELLDLAALMFQEVLEMRPEEPQSHRDLALALARRAEQKDAKQRGEDYRRAIELLNHVVMNQWDRFAEIEVIALMELNRIIPKAKQAGLQGIAVDPRLIKPLDVDVRIVLTWDMDMTDLDLWVTEPTGEKCYYGHNQTMIGGAISRDITNGYGPEEYILKKGLEGVYRIEANYYGSNVPQLAGTATLQAVVFTNYGRPNEERRAITLRLAQKGGTVAIGEVEFKK